MGVPKISILAYDLASNALGRALLLGELLHGLADVKIVGPSRNGEVWQPAQSSRIPIEVGPAIHSRGDLHTASTWLRQVDLGDTVLVSKAMPTSLGLALDTNLGGRNLALDIDDWEYGLCQGLARRPLAHAFAQVVGPMMRHRPNHSSRIQKLEARIDEIPNRLVSNTFLQDRFGGQLLYHVRDHQMLNPDSVDSARVRNKLALGDRVWVGFIGTFRPHKGIDDLISAVYRAAGSPGLLLMGIDEQDPAITGLIASARELLGPNRVRVLPPFPLTQLPEHVHAADIIAIPSKSGPASDGQIPAKLFDAMALARPIVATAVNDIPSILQDCGHVVAPDNANELADAIGTYACDRERRAHCGAAARQRLIESYSFDAGRRVMADFLTEIAT